MLQVAVCNLRNSSLCCVYYTTSAVDKNITKYSTTTSSSGIQFPLRALFTCRDM